MRRVRSAVVALVVGAIFTAAASAEPQPIDRIVAVVNEDVVLRSELDAELQTVKMQLREQQTQIPPDHVLERQVLERLVVNRVQLQQARDMGIRVDDETVNRTIASIARDNNLTMDQFRQVLAQEGIGFPQFRENIREQMIITRLRDRQVNERVRVSEREVDQFLESRAAAGDDSREFHLGHILIALPEAPSSEQVEEAQREAEAVVSELRDGADFAETAVAISDGQQALEGGDLGWRERGRLPSVFADEVPRMSPGDIQGPIRSPSGFHILKVKDVREGDRHVVTQTRARHILLRPDALNTDTEIRERLTRIRERIADGELDFTEAAQEHSADPGSAAEGGDLGWIAPGDMVPGFERQVQALEPGQLSEPFQTQFGWHIVEVLDRRDYDDTEERRRARVRQQLHQRKAEERTETWLRSLRDEAYVELRLDADTVAGGDTDPLR